MEINNKYQYFRGLYINEKRKNKNYKICSDFLKVDICELVFAFPEQFKKLAIKYKRKAHKNGNQ